MFGHERYYCCVRSNKRNATVIFLEERRPVRGTAHFRRHSVFSSCPDVYINVWSLEYVRRARAAAQTAQHILDNAVVVAEWAIVGKMAKAVRKRAWRPSCCLCAFNDVLSEKGKNAKLLPGAFDLFMHLRNRARGQSRAHACLPGCQLPASER